MNNIEQKIRLVIKQTRNVFRAASGPRLRCAYRRQNNINGDRDWICRLTADEIINMHIPSRVVGHVGRARVFCKFAAAIGIDCRVVLIANNYDIADYAAGLNDRIDLRILFAIEVDGRLRAFDAFSHGHPVWYDCAVYPGNFVKVLRYRPPYKICAILPCDEFANCNTCRHLYNACVHGEIRD